MDSGKYFLTNKKPTLDQAKLEHIIKHALIEDIGKGDITTLLTIPQNKEIKAVIISKENCIICGMPAAQKTFEIMDTGMKFIPCVKDGDAVKKGAVFVKLSGKARSILSAERVALNLLTMLSGIATKTRKYVLHIHPYKTKITDTRKTIPGLRDLQKYAVRVGGGYNHRMSLDEMILIKDNHLKVNERLTKLPNVPKGFKVEVEVQNLDEFKHAISLNPDVIMLDNMKLKDIKKAIEIRNTTRFKSYHLPIKLEASGGVDFKNVRKLAASGIDIISIGALTHTVKAINMSLEVL